MWGTSSPEIRSAASIRPGARYRLPGHRAITPRWRRHRAEKPRRRGTRGQVEIRRKSFLAAGAVAALLVVSCVGGYSVWDSRVVHSFDPENEPWMTSAEELRGIEFSSYFTAPELGEVFQPPIEDEGVRPEVILAGRMPDIEIQLLPQLTQWLVEGGDFGVSADDFSLLTLRRPSERVETVGYRSWRDCTSSAVPWDLHRDLVSALGDR